MNVPLVCTAAPPGFGRWADELARRGLVVPSLAAGGVAAIGQLQQGRADALLALAAWLLCYASYLIDAASDAPGPEASARTLLLASRRSQVRACGLAAFAAAMLIAGLQAGPWAAAALLLFPASVALYCLPLRRTAPRCVKDIPYAKGAYTAFFWGLLGAWAAACGDGGFEAGHLAFGFGLLAWRVGLNTLLCDTKDLARDRAAGVRTVALRLGLPRLLRLLVAADLAFAVLIVAAVALHGLPPAALGLVLTSLYFQALLRAAARPGCDLDRLCGLAADSEWAWWPLYLALAGALLG